MRFAALRIVLGVTAVCLMAALLFGAGYWVGRDRGGEVEHYIASGLRTAGLAALATQVAPTPVNSPDEIPLPAEDQERFEVFWEAWGWVERQFYDRSAIDRQKMVYGAIRGMLGALGDPHTVFLEPAHREISDSQLRGSFEGIGVQVDMVNGQLKVVSPLEGSPGDRAGLRPGDVIVKVDGKEIKGLSLMDTVLLIRGPKGTKVRLDVLREGSPELLTFEVVREEIKLETVRWQMRDAEVGYVRINSFSDNTLQQTVEALKDLKQQHASAIILDLRNNPGGYLDAAVEVASQFLPEGVVLYQEESDGQRQTFEVKPGGQATTLPVAVLVNKGTASASEIVAGAVQAHGRGPLIGEKTYGKGTVQNLHELTDSSSVRITFAHWLTPDEKPINGEGLTPDVEVPSPKEPGGEDRQVEAAVRYLREKVADAR